LYERVVVERGGNSGKRGTTPGNHMHNGGEEVLLKRTRRPMDGMGSELMEETSKAGGSPVTKL